MSSPRMIRRLSRSLSGLTKSPSSPSSLRRSTSSKEHQIRLSVPGIDVVQIDGHKTLVYEIIVKKKAQPDYSIKRTLNQFAFLAHRLPCNSSVMKFPGEKAPEKIKTNFIEDPRRAKFEKWIRSIAETHASHPELLRFLCPSGYALDDSIAPDQPYRAPVMPPTAPKKEKAFLGSVSSGLRNLVKNILGDEEKERDALERRIIAENLQG
eukprot:TRINITY_DN14887_c0_g1_i1.p1 TRINITY_DN14887_c0_g1~~TRINITY_DN14887_c0_g1_i1.p1  ORF type:complete len:209 (-),score=40.08 TRINITY_DN14887_c0_g1_i1:650-1276(-)